MRMSSKITRLDNPIAKKSLITIDTNIKVGVASELALGVSSYMRQMFQFGIADSIDASTKKTKDSKDKDCATERYLWGFVITPSSAMYAIHLEPVYTSDYSPELLYSRVITYRDTDSAYMQLSELLPVEKVYMFPYLDTEDSRLWRFQDPIIDTWNLAQSGMITDYKVFKPIVSAYNRKLLEERSINSTYFYKHGIQSLIIFIQEGREEVYRRHTF